MHTSMHTSMHTVMHTPTHTCDAHRDAHLERISLPARASTRPFVTYTLSYARGRCVAPSTRRRVALAGCPSLGDGLPGVVS